MSETSSYDEVLEARAEDILLIVSERSSTSGYSSDTETSLTSPESDSIGAENFSNCSSSVSSCTSDSESETIESEIYFLQQKQGLLQRAFLAMQREEIYEASIARETVANKGETTKSTLWDEASEIVDILNRRDNKTTVVTCCKKSPRPTSDTAARPKKRVKIDLSSVDCIFSSKMDEHDNSLPGASLSLPFKIPGPWMSRVLAQSIPNIHSNGATDSPAGWETAHDPNLGLLVIPPPGATLNGGMFLKDALQLSFEPRVLCQAVPPFAVVHVNKAFCIFSGLSPDNVVGKPVQTIVNVDGNTGGESKELTFSVDSPTTEEDDAAAKTFRMLAHPVRESPKKGISHLLLKVSPQTQERCGEAMTSLIKKNILVHDSNKLFGTVG